MNIESTIGYIAYAAKRFSQTCAAVSMLFAASLIVTMLYGVTLRYGLRSPPIWVFDISYMLNGVLFLMATGYTLLHEEHVRIDFLSNRFPERVQNGINSVAYLLLFIPAITLLILKSGEQTWNAYMSGKEAPLSAWSPVVWPFYAGVFIGLVSLWFQLIGDALYKGTKCITGQRRNTTG